MTLSTDGINQAIRELRDYQRFVIERTEVLRNRISEYIRDHAELGFDSSIGDDFVNGQMRMCDVDVETDDQGNVTVVIANGRDAVFVEFGAGVYHNGAVGGSPHPLGAGLGFTIGSFGKGYGSRNVWGYRDAGGALHLTHGVPATMPMYKALMAARNDLADIAREVFGN